MPAPHTAYTHPAAQTNPPQQRFVHRRVSLVLRTNDRVVSEFARLQFGAVLDPANHVYDHHVFIRVASDRIEAIFDGERLFEALVPESPGAKSTAAFYAVRDCFTHAISCQNECVIYGASLCVWGAGVLLLGPPGSGKTLLAIHLAALGAEMVGDDVAVLTDDGLLDAVPRSLSLRADRMSSLPAASLRNICNTPPVVGTGDHAMYALAPADCGIRQSSEPAPLRFVLFLDENGPVGVHLLEPRVAQALFLRYRQRGKRNVLQTPAPLRGVRAYRAGRHDPARLAERLAVMFQCA